MDARGRRLVALKKPAFDEVRKVQKALARRWGFEPSLSETIAYLASQWRKELDEA